MSYMIGKGQSEEQIRKQVFEYFNDLCGDADLCGLITSLAQFVSVKNEERILNAGERTDYICLVISGVVRGYYIDDAGNDITKCFSSEREWCCSYSYLSQMPSPFYIDAIEDTVLAEFALKDITQIIDQYPDFQKKVEQLLSETLMKSEQRILSFTAMEAKDRYLMLVKEQPELVERVKQEYIASYIGVTPSSLSRLKKKL